MAAIDIPQRVDVLFLDMDGVLCDFHTAVARLWGLDPTLVDDKQWAEIGEWGLAVPKPDFWDRIKAEGSSWWRELDELPWTKELWEVCHTRAERVAILTSPAPFAACHEGKRAWISKHFGRADVVVTSAKSLCAGPRRILIDDRTKYADGWRAAGGHFVPLRRPWTGGGASAQEIIAALSA